MLASGAPTKIQKPFANTGTKNTIPVASQIGVTPGAASYTDGFPPLTFLPVLSGGVPPFGEDFNGILNAITTIQQWQSAGGVFAYDSAQSTAIGGYPKDCIVAKATGTGFWVSTADNNTTNPDTGGAGWTDLSNVLAFSLINIQGTAAGPLLKMQNGNLPTYTEYSLSGYTTKVSFGALGAIEWNGSYNMDYSTGVHRLYNTAENGIWIAMNNSGFFLQYAPATAMVGDVWTGQGSLYNLIIDNPTGNMTLRGQINSKGIANIGAFSTSTTADITGNTGIGAAHLAGAALYVKGIDNTTGNYTATFYNLGGTELFSQDNTGVSRFGGIVRPITDNTYTLGTSAMRWSVVYAGTGAINTSDKEQKIAVTFDNDQSAALDKWSKTIDIRAFRFKDAFAAKGDAARIHWGVFAQDVLAAGMAAGVADPFEHGFLCRDQAEKTVSSTVTDEGGGERTVSEQVPLFEEDGTTPVWIYGIRYDELVMFLLAHRLP